MALAPGTIKTTICFHQISRGLPDYKISEVPQLEYVIKGIQQDSPSSSRSRMPITSTILINLKQVLQRCTNKYDAILIWAAAFLWSFGFHRSGEVYLVTPTEMSLTNLIIVSIFDVKVQKVMLILLI